MPGFEYSNWLGTLLNGRGFEISPHTGVPGDYVVERAFVER